MWIFKKIQYWGAFSSWCLHNLGHGVYWELNLRWNRRRNWSSYRTGSQGSKLVFKWQIHHQFRPHWNLAHSSRQRYTVENMKPGEAAVWDFRSRSVTKPLVYGKKDSAPQEQAVRISFTWIWFSAPVPLGSLNSEELTKGKIKSNGLG